MKSDNDQLEQKFDEIMQLLKEAQLSKTTDMSNLEKLKAGIQSSLESSDYQTSGDTASIFEELSNRHAQKDRYSTKGKRPFRDKYSIQDDLASHFSNNEDSTRAGDTRYSSFETRTYYGEDAEQRDNCAACGYFLSLFFNGPSFDHDRDRSVDGRSLQTDYTERTEDYTIQTDDFTVQTDDYTARTDDYTARTDDYTTRTDDYTTRTDDYTTRTDDYTTRTDGYTEKTDDYTAQTDDYTIATSLPSSDDGATTLNTIDSYSEYTYDTRGEAPIKNDSFDASTFKADEFSYSTQGLSTCYSNGTHDTQLTELSASDQFANFGKQLPLDPARILAESRQNISSDANKRIDNNKAPTMVPKDPKSSKQYNAKVDEKPKFPKFRFSKSFYNPGSKEAKSSDCATKASKSSNASTKASKVSKASISSKASKGSKKPSKASKISASSDVSVKTTKTTKSTKSSKSSKSSKSNFSKKSPKLTGIKEDVAYKTTPPKIDKKGLGNTIIMTGNNIVKKVENASEKKDDQLPKPLKSPKTKKIDDSTVEASKPPTKSGMNDSSTKSSKSSQDSILKKSKHNSNQNKNLPPSKKEPEALDYDLEPVLLYRAIDTKQWKLALNRLKSHPEEAKTWVCRYKEDDVIAWKFLPLHAACFSGAPGELVEKLVSAYPEAVRMSVYGAKLPIHIACETGAARDVVVCLVEAFPDSLCMTEYYGNTPLELCKNGTGKNKSQLMKILLKPANVESKKFGLFKKRR
jgi:hypothetical protein